MLSVERDIHEWLYGEDATSEALMRAKGHIRGHFGQFVRGEEIDDLYFMKRVEDRRQNPADFSHGVWSISPRFDPQFRFFGFFVITDWFVVLTKQSRDALARSETAWYAEIDNCLKIWGDLFPNRSPWIPDELHEFVASKGVKLDDRW